MLQLDNMNRKGVSEVIGYVLLIVIAVGLSVIVFNYLKVIVPKGEKPVCLEDVALAVQEYSCSANKNITLTLSNKGLFTVDAIYVRLAPPNRKIGDQVNKDNVTLEIKPGESKKITYIITGALAASGPGEYTLEVQPAVQTDKGLAVCEKAVISQKINCS